MDAWMAARTNPGNDFSTHMPLEHYVDKMNSSRKELSLSLFHYLNHANTLLRTRSIEDVAAEAH